ncbi:MAG: SDR family oxidoreductase [Rhodothermia bacterium]|nr:MAG: SDR family oxidoreductase [Rhodothermia bacterium]
MDFGLEGASAFVAGASSGLGKAIATELVSEGCHVAICSRDQARVEAAAEDLNQLGKGRTLPVVCDVTVEDQIQAALQLAAEALGGLNILVTNAGGPPSGFVEDFDAEAWRDALELNLMSTINLSRHALPFLRAAAKDSFARILMVTSLTSKQPVPSLYLSNVSRAGVQGFAKSLSEELGPEGITVNTILPGYTRTDRLRHLSEAQSERSGKSIEEIEADWGQNCALKRIGTETEIAAAATFLLSRRASYITGIALSVDGGAVKSLL